MLGTLVKLLVPKCDNLIDRDNQQPRPKIYVFLNYKEGEKNDLYRRRMEKIKL